MLGGLKRSRAHAGCIPDIAWLSRWCRAPLVAQWMGVDLQRRSVLQCAQQSPPRTLGAVPPRTLGALCQSKVVMAVAVATTNTSASSRSWRLRFTVHQGLGFRA